MILFIIAYLGGVLTILSPCILPVLPFVFARAGQPFIKTGLPMLVGMAISFAGVATLAAVGGSWAIEVNQYGRLVAIALLGLFGVTLLFPAVADHLTRPVVDFGARLSQSAAYGASAGASAGPSFVLGIATGFLWAPCAGPILGLILTGAALQGANAQTSFVLLAYAAGAATSLALALMIGGRVFAAMKASLGAGEWMRRALGVAVLCGVGAIALGLDTTILARLSAAGATTVEQALIDRIDASVANPPTAMILADETKLPVEGVAPELSGAVEWLNSPPLSMEKLRGKAVLVDFWTYSCINCLRTIPYVKAWAEKYKDQGLVVIGVHAPEFAFEKDIDNVRAQAKDLGITYPIAIDNDFAIWRASANSYWPAHYFIDAKGQVRYHHFGEGDYIKSEQVIQQLLKEAGGTVVPNVMEVDPDGAETAMTSTGR